MNAARHVWAVVALRAVRGSLVDDDQISSIARVDFRRSANVDVAALSGVVRHARRYWAWIRRDHLFATKAEAERAIALRELAR